MIFGACDLVVLILRSLCFFSQSIFLVRCSVVQALCFLIFGCCCCWLSLVLFDCLQRTFVVISCCFDCDFGCDVSGMRTTCSNLMVVKSCS